MSSESKSIPARDMLAALRENPEAHRGTGTHPGVMFLEEWLEPLGISLWKAAADMDIPKFVLAEITSGQRPINAEAAVRFGLYTGMPAEWWLGQQSDYDLRLALRDMGPRALKDVDPVRLPDGPTWDELIADRAAKRGRKG